VSPAPAYLFPTLQQSHIVFRGWEGFYDIANDSNGLLMEEILALAGRLVFIEYKSAAEGSGDRSWSPLDAALGKFW